MIFVLVLRKKRFTRSPPHTSSPRPILPFPQARSPRSLFSCLLARLYHEEQGPTIDWGSYQPQKLQGRRMRALDWCLVSIMHGWQVQGRRGTRGDACCGESQLRAGCGADYGDPLLVGLSSADWGVSATGYDLPRIIFRLRPTILRVRLNHRRGQLTRQG